MLNAYQMLLTRNTSRGNEREYRIKTVRATLRGGSAAFWGVCVECVEGGSDRHLWAAAGAEGRLSAFQGGVCQELCVNDMA